MRYRAAAEADPTPPASRRCGACTARRPTSCPPSSCSPRRARAAGDVRGAERLYRDAIRRRPHGVLLERLVALHAASGQTERALPILRDACAGNRLPAPRLHAGARPLVLAGKHPAAEAELAELVRETPAHRADGIDIVPERDLVAGELALARGHDREAATLLGRAGDGLAPPLRLRLHDVRRTSRASGATSAAAAATGPSSG